jgi:hypothetical protein
MTTAVTPEKYEKVVVPLMRLVSDLWEQSLEGGREVELKP